MPKRPLRTQRWSDRGPAKAISHIWLLAVTQFQRCPGACRNADISVEIANGAATRLYGKINLETSLRLAIKAAEEGHLGPRGAVAMIRIREIDHLVLRVVNLDAMLKFYCDVLGCTIERRQEEIGLIQLRAGRSLLDLVTVDGKLGSVGGTAPGTEGRNLDHFCFRVDPFDEPGIRRHLEANGVDAGPTTSRYGAEGYGPSIYVTDPERNVVELKGPQGS